MWLVFYIVVFLPQIILHILFNKEIGSWAWKLNARHREREKLSPSGPRWSFSQLRGGFPLAVLCRRRRGRGSTCKSRSRQQTGTLHAHWLTAQWASDECSTLPGTVLLTGDEAVPQKDQEGKNLHLKECACSDFLSCLCGGTGTARGAGCAAGSWAKHTHRAHLPVALERDTFGSQESHCGYKEVVAERSHVTCVRWQLARAVRTQVGMFLPTML